MAFGIDTLTDAVKDLGLGSTLGLAGIKADAIYGQAPGLFAETGLVLGDTTSVPWNIDGQDWYKVFAYQFVVKVQTDQKAPEEKKVNQLGFLDAVTAAFSGGVDNPVNPQEMIYTLPIPPQSMTTRMIAASQATPTVGGVVEETGGNVFWLINMSGTTGIGVSRKSDGSAKRSEVAKQFRDKITTTGLLSGPLAGINSAISKIGGVADSVIGGISSAQASGNPLDAVSGLVGAVNTALLPPLPYAGSGVDRETNGYTEMMELQRFLYTYSKLKSTNPAKYSLVFRNYKTNQEWECVLQDFQMQQNSQSPMLMRYSVALKCWNVRTPNGDRKKSEFDRFGPKGDLKAVSTIDPFQMAKLVKAMTGAGDSTNLLIGA